MAQDDELPATLKRIETKLDKLAAQARQDVLSGVGTAAMIGSLAALPFNSLAAVAIFVLGFIVMLVSPLLSRRQ